RPRSGRDRLWHHESRAGIAGACGPARQRGTETPANAARRRVALCREASWHTSRVGWLICASVLSALCRFAAPISIGPPHRCGARDLLDDEGEAVMLSAVASRPRGEPRPPRDRDCI